VSFARYAGISGRVVNVTSPNRFSSLQEFVDQGMIISGDKFLRKSLSARAFNYFKRDFLYKSGTWRGAKITSLVSHHEEYLTKPLVMGHSDIPTTKLDSFVLKKLGIPKIFAVNSQPVRDFAEPLPLGITNDCDDSPLHRVLGNESHFLQANSVDFQTENFVPSIYVNFSAGNNSRVRNHLLSVTKEISSLYKVTFETPNFTNDGRVSYLEKLRSIGLVLCPEGNGVDTHRFWETIYMGGTPIVTSNSAMQSFYDDLPVIQLHSWNELSDISGIENKWWELSQKTFNFDILSIEYWATRFVNQ